MPGTPGRSGGRRRGQPGKKYPNRSDLRAQKVATTPNQPYGQATQQAAAQKAMPLPQAAGSGSPSTSALAGMVGGGGPQPVVPLTDPSARPNEPVTAGLPNSPGAGPDALGLPQQASPDDDILATLQGLYQAFPNSDLGRLIASMDAKDTPLAYQPVKPMPGWQGQRDRGPGDMTARAGPGPNAALVSGSLPRTNVGK
jgi:hypothetical protein